MQRTTLFIGLTRSVTFAGLPITYLVVLMGIVMIGFILTKSFIYLVLSAAVGYPILRGLSAYDPKILDVFFVVQRCTPVNLTLFSKAGETYHA